MKLLSVRQKLISRPLPDVASEVRAQLDSLKIKPPSGRVAIPVGSRGIANLPTIIRTAGDWLREQGAEPFMVPAMGSHNGATAEGQQQMIESLGITAEAMQMPIQSSMDCVKLATVATGNVWMDKHCYEADGVLVINRIKLHTCFSGPVQSGLTKMMVVGMGKIQSAETFHSSPTPVMKDMLLEMGQAIVATGKIWAGLAILEDGFDETAELHAVPAQNILSREPDYLAKHRDYFPAIPLDQLNVLIVDQIGKTFSGTGMDTNVIGYRGVRGYEDLDRPCIKIIGALGLSQATQGNAIGVGLADFITKRLRDAMDEKKLILTSTQRVKWSVLRSPPPWRTTKRLSQPSSIVMGPRGGCLSRTPFIWTICMQASICKQKSKSILDARSKASPWSWSLRQGITYSSFELSARRSGPQRSKFPHDVKRCS